MPFCKLQHPTCTSKAEPPRAPLFFPQFRDSSPPAHPCAPRLHPECQEEEDGGGRMRWLSSCICRRMGRRKPQEMFSSPSTMSSPSSCTRDGHLRLRDTNSKEWYQETMLSVGIKPNSIGFWLLGPCPKGVSYLPVPQLQVLSFIVDVVRLQV